MARFIVRRLLWMIPTVIIVTFVVYVACRVAWHPEQSYQRANPRAGARRIEEFKQINGLYEGFGGYFRGYGEWLWKFVRGPDHWPRSIKGQGEVWEPLRYSFFNTLRLAGISAVLGISLGIGLGILASRRPGGWLDSLVNTTAYYVGAIPPFVSGVMLQLAFAVSLGWLPAAGVYPPGQQGFDLWLMIKHLTLPVLVVLVQTVAQYSRFTRASVLDVASSDFLRTARSKGISERRVLFRHSVRNALVPVVTVIGIDLGALLGGLIITENIFNYPGMGVYFVEAANEGDFPKLLPFLVIIVVAVIIFNLIADIMYAVLDPRIRLD
jgi:peptide/nickel transport system permease protein